jgi:hypothetical protein
VEPTDPEFLAKLKRLRWTEQTYRALSYSFSVRCHSAAMARSAHRVLGAFAEPPNGGSWGWVVLGEPSRYTLVKTGGLYQLLLDDVMVTTVTTQALAVGSLLRAIQKEVFRRSSDFFLIHAGAVATPEGLGVLLPASSYSGKSTLTLGLVLSGFGYFSDDAAAIDPVTRTLHPYPLALSMKYGRAHVFHPLRSNLDWAGILKDDWHVPPGEIRTDVIAQPSQVGFVIFPRYTPNASTQLATMTQGEAAVALMENAINLPVYRGRALTLIGDILRDATCYRMVVGDLREAVEVVKEITRTPQTTSLSSP